MDQLLARDEREVAVDRAGDRLAYLALSYGLLLVVAYRAFVDGQASWELLGLVVGAGTVGAGYRVWHRAGSRQTLTLAAITMLAAALVALVIVLAGRG